MLCIIVLIRFGPLFEQSPFDKLDRIPTSIGVTASLVTPKGVADPESLKPMHSFTGCAVSLRCDLVDSVFSYCQRLNKSFYCRSQGVKLFGLCKCRRLYYINTILPLASTGTSLWMWKYFAVFLMWACILLSENSYNKSQANPQLC